MGDNDIIQNLRSAKAYFLSGCEKYSLHQYLEALEDFTKALEIHPVIEFDDQYYTTICNDIWSNSYLNVYENRGKTKNRLGDFLGAMEDFTKYIDNYQNNEKIYIYRGFVRNNLGDYQGAMEDYIEAHKININIDINISCGILKSRLGDYQGAIESFRKSITFEKEYCIYLSWEKEIYSDYQEAINRYNEIIDNDHEVNDVYFDRGVAKRYTGDYRGAIQDFNKILENHLIGKSGEFDISLVYNHRGYIKYISGDYQGAMEDYISSIMVDPHEHEIIYNNLGSAKSQLQDYIGAMEAFTEALDGISKSSWHDHCWHNSILYMLYSNRGRAREKFGDYQCAIVDFTSAIETISNNVSAYNVYFYNRKVSAYNNRGVIKDKIGDIYGAIEDFLKVNKLESGEIDNIT